MAPNGLSRVPLVFNQNYTRSGIKSYVYLLQKCKHSASKSTLLSTHALRPLVTDLVRHRR